mmetsp:Transcript_14663/g.61947  ORF Transcript_14663/g.61947 Transcript_14663/m.61947 type:complete len:299 (-) Transcript_14663:426-1322(-)
MQVDPGRHGPSAGRSRRRAGPEGGATRRTRASDRARARQATRVRAGGPGARRRGSPRRVRRARRSDRRVRRRGVRRLLRRRARASRGSRPGEREAHRRGVVRDVPEGKGRPDGRVASGRFARILRRELLRRGGAGGGVPAVRAADAVPGPGVDDVRGAGEAVQGGAPRAVHGDVTGGRTGVFTGGRTGGRGAVGGPRTTAAGIERGRRGRARAATERVVVAPRVHPGAAHGGAECAECADSDAARDEQPRRSLERGLEIERRSDLEGKFAGRGGRRERGRVARVIVSSRGTGAGRETR